MYDRDFYDDLLIHTCDTYRKNTSTTSTGTVTYTWVSIASDVVCLIQAMSKEIEVVPAGTETPLKYRAFFKHDADIQEGDKVVWESRNFLVYQAPPQDGSGHEHHREVILEQIR